MPPTLLFACHPLTGHVTPVLRIAAGLRARGWHVAFLSSDFFRARIEAAGLQFVSLQGAADLDDKKLFAAEDEGVGIVGPFTTAEREQLQLPQSITDARHQTLAALSAEWDSVKKALERLVQEKPGEQIFLVSEAFFYGSMPLKYGAPLPASVAAAVIPRTLCISITAPAIFSMDLPPFGAPEPFDPTEEGRKRNAHLWAAWTRRVEPLSKLLRKELRVAGAVDTSATGKVDDVVFLGGANYSCHDAIALVGVPQLEYPRCDFPPGFQIVGVVPPVAPKAEPGFPWWKDLVSNQKLPQDQRKKVVVVAQGTVETDPRELILPTLQLLGSRESDVLTVAILGVKNATISAAETLPRNGHVADYLSYDAVLPYADLWVHNGGYGATMHGIAHGVPMVIAGDGQDKPENGKRVQWSGLGIDLASARPAREKLAAALTEVLAKSSFKRVAREMQKTAQEMDCFGNVEKIILGLIDEE